MSSVVHALASLVEVPGEAFQASAAFARENAALTSLRAISTNAKPFVVLVASSSGMKMPSAQQAGTSAGTRRKA